MKPLRVSPVKANQEYHDNPSALENVLEDVNSHEADEDQEEDDDEETRFITKKSSSKPHHNYSFYTSSTERT
jgi:hypothetical protein